MVSSLWLLTLICITSRLHSKPSDGCNILSQPSPNNSTIQFSFSHNGLNRIYIVHVPPNYAQNSSIGSPLVFGLHGFTSNATRISELFRMNQHADLHNYIAIYPQGSFMLLNITETNSTQIKNVSSWNDLSCSGSNVILSDELYCNPFAGISLLGFVNDTSGYPPECSINDPFNCNWCNCLADDIDFIDKLLDYILAKYCINSERIYSLGFSNGGMMTQRLGCALNHRFAAIAPFHGQMSPPQNCVPETPEDDNRFIPMPILNVWGLTDDIVPGESISSSVGAYFSSVLSVMLKFGNYNGCDLRNGYKSIETVSDGIMDWKCIAFNDNCIDGSETISCSWDGGHIYPLTTNLTNDEIYNFGLEVVWNFFERHTLKVIESNYSTTPDLENIVIIVSVSVLSVILVVTIWFCYCRRRKKYSVNDAYNTTHDPSQPLTSTK